MIATVYHDKKPTFGFGPTAKNFPNDFEVVATVESDDPEVVFALTNSVEQEWWENAGVIHGKPARSTSVGDVIVIGDHAYLCLPMGFRDYDCGNEDAISIPGNLFTR